MNSRQSAHQQLLLGEWACLGILSAGKSHGFAVAAALKPDGEIGRVWALSRALTYRALDQLSVQGLIEPIASEPGIAGGNRTVLAITKAGRAELKKWLATPVPHLRDVRSELLLKLVLARKCGINVAPLLRAQRDVIAATATALHQQAQADSELDVVAVWRHESSTAALRFVKRISDSMVL